MEITKLLTYNYRTRKRRESMFNVYLMGGPLNGEFIKTSDRAIIELHKNIKVYKPVKVRYKFLLSILSFAIYIWEDMTQEEAVSIISNRITHNEYKEGYLKCIEDVYEKSVAFARDERPLKQVLEQLKNQSNKQ